MSRLFVQSETVAARRRFPLYLVDITDGITPETGEAGGQPQISKVGGAWANTTATLTSIGNGAYYVELTAAELDTLGLLMIRYKSGNTAEFNMDGEVVVNNIHGVPLVKVSDYSVGKEPGNYLLVDPNNLLDVDGLGRVIVSENQDKVGYDVTNATIDRVWDEIKADHAVAGSFGVLLDAAISSRPTVSDIWNHGTRTLTAFAFNVTVGAMTAPALAQFFTLSSGTTYASAVAGSVVKEIATNSSTVVDNAAIAAAVWNSLRANHVTVGTFGEGVSSVKGNVQGEVASLGTQAKDDVKTQVLTTMSVTQLIDGRTITEALTYIGAMTVGLVSGAGTGTEVFKGFNGSIRVTVQADGSGNRSSVVLN